MAATGRTDFRYPQVAGYVFAMSKLMINCLIVTRVRYKKRRDISTRDEARVVVDLVTENYLPTE